MALDVQVRPRPTTPASRSARITDGVVSGALAVAGMAIIVTVVDLMDRGLDLTDGGNSWNIAANPGASPLTVSQAGHVLHPLFRLLGQNEVLFQRTNALATVALMTGLGWGVLRRFDGGTGDSALDHGRDVALALALGASATAMLFQWQSPPNYKWLTLQGLTLVAIGALIGPTERMRGDLLAGIVIGVGGWLAFMGRPPSAALAGMLVLTHTVATRASVRRLLVAGGAATTLLVGAMIAIDGSVASFLSDLRMGTELGALLTPSQDVSALLDLDRPFWPTVTWIVLGGATVVLSSAVGTVTRRRTPTAVGTRTPVVDDRRTVVVVVLALAAVIVVSSTWSWWPDFHPSMGVWLLAVPAAVALNLRGRGRRRTDRGGHDLADAVLLLVWPFAFAFGSGTTQWHEASRAAAFWLIAAVPLVALVAGPARRRRNALAVAVAAGLVATAGLVHVGIRQPYRQAGTVRAMTTPAPALVDLDGLLVSSDRARFLATFVNGARADGFAAETGVIDLSGASPGLVHVLGGTPLGRSWLLGSYPGSEAVAIDLLARESCEVLARAWVIDGPGTKRALGPEVAASIGLDPPTDLVLVAEADQANQGDGPRRLLAPARPVADAAAACRQARAGLPSGPDPSVDLGQP